MGAAARAGSRVWALVAVAIGIALVNLDLSALTVALPSVQRDLHAPLQGGEWVLNAYVLAVAAFVVPAGRLADIAGRRRVFAGAAALFAGASLLGVLAPSIGVLIASRVLQGAASAAILPTATAIIASLYPPDERRAPLSDILVVASVAAAVGPLVGGALTAGIDWRAVLAINVPLGLVALLGTRRIPESRDPTAAGLDVRGAVVLAAGLAAIVLGLDQTNVRGWSSPAVWALLTAGTVLLAVFVAVERRGTSPLVPLRLFSRRGFVGPVVVGLLVFFGAIPFDLFVAQFAQRVLSYGPAGAGLALLPSSVAVAIAAPLASRVGDRVGSRGPVVLGVALVAAALALVAGLDVDSDFGDLLPPLLLMGLGLGSCIGLLGAAAINAVETERAGAAAGIGHMARMTGAALGIAVTAALFEIIDHHHVRAALTAGKGYGSSTREAFAYALGTPFVVAAAVVAVGAVVALLTVRDPPRAGRKKSRTPADDRKGTPTR